jgi:hypothetical protein
MEGAGKYTTCPHGRLKELVVCRQCCEAAMTQAFACVSVDQAAKKARSRCAPSKLPCEHSSEKRRCKICVGSWVCAHGKNKVFCGECDGRRLCQTCRAVTLPRCYEVCRKCLDKEGESAGEKGRKRKASGREGLCI